MRMRVAVPAHTMLLLDEAPLLCGRPPARLEAVCDEVRESDGRPRTSRTPTTHAHAAQQAVQALKCMRSVPERMLAFAAAPEDVRVCVLDMWCGGGPGAWPLATADTDIVKCVILRRGPSFWLQLTRLTMRIFLGMEATR